jgi:hypothetical protein
VSSREERPEQPESPRAFVCPWCEMPALAIVRGTAIWDGWNKEGTFPVTLPVEYALVQCSECREGSVQIREDFGRGFQDDKPGIVCPANESSAEMFLRPCAENSKRRRPVSQPRHTKRQSSWFVVFLREHAKRITFRREPLLKAWKNSKPMGLSIIRLRSGRMPFAFSEMRVRTTLEGKVPRDDSEDALAFAEALLDHIYVLRKRFEEFARRRSNKKASQRGGSEGLEPQPSDP